MSRRLPIPRRTTLRRYSESLIGDEWSGTTLRLSIRVTDEGVTARDLAAYLRLLDSAYGRTSPDGYLSYAQRPSEHVRLTSIRSGSVIMEVVRELANPSGLWGMLLAYLVLRTGPKLMTGEVAKNWGEAAKSWGEALQVWGDLFVPSNDVRANRLPTRLTRTQRRRLRLLIREDGILGDLERKDIDKLVAAVELVLVRERDNLNGAARFSAACVHDITLDVVKDNDSAIEQ